MRALALLTLVALLVPAGAAGAAKKPHRSACQKLAARHTDRSPLRKLVLVQSGGFETGSIRACVLPRGKVRRLAEWDDGLGRASVELTDVAGYFVLVSEGWGDQYGGVSSDLYRVDARTGRRLHLAGYGCWAGYGQMLCSDGTSAGDVVLARSGAGAVDVTDLATQATTLQAFDRNGTFTKLADGPVDDLRLEDGQVVWSAGGTEQRADLP